MEPEALGGEVLADDRHREVGAVLAAVFFRQRIAIVPGLVSEFSHLAQQRFPFMAREALIFENRCAPIRGDGRRNGYCHPCARAA